MDNIYERLRQETQTILGDSWENYPAITNFDTFTVFSSKDESIQLRIATQDGFPIIGIAISNGITNKQYSPSRKWGQFRNEKEARLWALGFLLKHISTFSAEAFEAVYSEINKTQQLSIF